MSTDPWFKRTLACHLVFLFLLSLLIGCGGSARSTNLVPNPETNPLPSTPPLPQPPPPPPPPPPAPSVSISSDKNSVFAGDPATLTWSSNNATAASIDNGIGSVSLSGSQQVRPTTDTTYTITATGEGGTATASVTITISDTRSPVKHLVIVVMQNRSFDHLFGKFPGAAGAMPGDPGYVQQDANGNDVSPFLLTRYSRIDLDHSHAGFVKMVDGGKMDQFALVNGATAMGFYDDSVEGIDALWELAHQFALADNFFASVLGDAPTNQLYMVAASDNKRPFGVQPFFGPCNLPDDASKPYIFENVGDQLSAKNLEWSWFAETYANCATYHPTQNPFQYFTSTQNSPHILDFAEFRAALTSGSLPSVAFIQPTDAHAMHPSSASTVTVGALWVTSLVQDIQNSSSWPHTAIIVVWDSSGGWYDHVPPAVVDGQGFGPRVPLLVISPFSQQNYISKTQMDDVSILKFIQWNWGLKSLNERNASAESGDLRDIFKF